MYQNQELSFDPAHPLQVLKQGTFEQWITVKGRWRRYLGGYEDPAHRYGIKKGEIPLPVWVIGSREPDTAAVAHWRNSCRADTAAPRKRYDSLAAECASQLPAE